MYLTIWLFPFRDWQNLAAAKRQTTPLQGSKLQGSKSLVASATKNWVLASNWLPVNDSRFLLSTFEPQRTTLLVDKRYDLFKKIKHQLDCHVWFSTFFILRHKLNNASTKNPSFFFALITVNIRLSHRKTSKWLQCSKSPYNALQTLGRWVCHICILRYTRYTPAAYTWIFAAYSDSYWKPWVGQKITQSETRFHCQSTPYASCNVLNTCTKSLYSV